MRSTRAMEVMARWGLAVLWGGVAWLAFRGARVRGAFVCGVAAAALALAASARWHVALMNATRAWLRGQGLYERRGVVKLAIVTVVVLLVLGASRWWWRQSPGLRGALAATLGFAAYLAAYTVLLYDYVPSVLRQPPGRQLLELAFVVPALLCVKTWRRADARAR